MARVFVTGSADGLGQMAAQLLIEQGHGVVLHARNEQRGKEAMAAVPGAESVVIGDLTSHVASPEIFTWRACTSASVPPFAVTFI